MDRRSVLAGLAAIGLAAPAIAAPSAQRTFRILRDGDEIGRHTMIAVLGTDAFTIDIEIDISVKVLGITAYRYYLANRERWRAGRIETISSTTNDDGTEESASVRRSGGMLRIEGTRHSGTVPLDAVTTSYFAPAFLDRRPWISTQSGDPLDVSVTQAPAGWWQVSGDLTTRLGYDRRGEWIGCEFDAGGETARYEVIGETGRIAELWSQA